MNHSKKYKKNLKLLQYDLLYGSDFISLQEGIKREPTQIDFGIKDIVIRQIRTGAEGYLIYGVNFTPESRVYVDGRAVKTKYHNQSLLEIPAGSLHNKDELVIHQVSQTNEKITLNQSDPIVWIRKK